jgi:hypothetical protein
MPGAALPSISASKDIAVLDVHHSALASPIALRTLSRPCWSGVPATKHDTLQKLLEGRMESSELETYRKCWSPASPGVYFYIFV